MARRMTARQQRLTALRSSVLLSALAVEATVNQFLAIVLPPADVRTVDRMKTLDKLIVGPRLAGTTTLSTGGESPCRRSSVLLTHATS